MKKGEWKETAAIIGVVMAAFVIYAVAVWLLSITLVAMWIPLACGALVALLTLVAVRRGRGVVWCCCYALLMTGLVADLALGANYGWRDSAAARRETCAVERVYSETRHRTKRINRRTVGRGEPYKVYYMDVRLPGGYTRKRSLTLSEYNSMARKRTPSVTVTVTPGLFGLSVLEY